MAFREGMDLKLVTSTMLGMVQTIRQAECEEAVEWGREVLNHACRHLEQFVTPEVSVAAQQRADGMRLGPLSQYRWRHQPTRMKDPGRTIFHWEHVLPVSRVRDLLLRDEVQTEHDVASILRLADIAWILKEEDDGLTDRGFRFGRPDDPWDAYAAAGIPIVGR